MTKMLKTVACAVLIGLVGCQYIQPVAAVLSLLAGRQERIVYVEVEVPQVDKEPAETAESPATGE